MKAEAKKKRQQERASAGQSKRTKIIIIAVLAVAAAAYAVATFTPEPAAESGSPTLSTFRRMSVDEFKPLFDRGSVVVIDVRDANAYAAQHIPGALQIPLSRIQGEIPYLPKDKTIVTYCTCPAEESSGAAVEILRNGGLTDAAALTGGLDAWTKRGYPVKSGTER